MSADEGPESAGPLGEDPDPRFTFANERTFLAWNRTALGLIGAGLAAAQFLHFDIKGLRLLVALPLILSGALVGFTSFRRWETSERALRLERPLPASPLPRLLAIGVCVAAVVCAIVVAVDLLAH